MRTFFLTINANNIQCISKKDYILLINTLTQICIITNSTPVIINYYTIYNLKKILIDLTEKSVVVYLSSAKTRTLS